MPSTTLSLHVGWQCWGGSADEPRGPCRGHVYLTPWPDSQSAVRPALTAERGYDLRGHRGSSLTGSSLKRSRDRADRQCPCWWQRIATGSGRSISIQLWCLPTEADEQLKMYFSVSKILYVVYFFLNNGSCQNGFLKTWEFKMTFCRILKFAGISIFCEIFIGYFLQEAQICLLFLTPCNFLEWMRYSVMSRLQLLLISRCQKRPPVW